MSVLLRLCPSLYLAVCLPIRVYNYLSIYLSVSIFSFPTHALLSFYVSLSIYLSCISALYLSCISICLNVGYHFLFFHIFILILHPVPRSSSNNKWARKWNVPRKTVRSHKGISWQTDGGVSYSDSENAAGCCGRNIVGSLKFVDFPFKRLAGFFCG